MNPQLFAGTLEMLILELVSEGPSYGYEITQQVTNRSSNEFELKEGSLYPALHKMQRKKLLKSFWREVDGRRRKYYELTVQGQKVLNEKREEWKQFSSAIDRILGAQSGLA